MSTAVTLADFLRRRTEDDHTALYEGERSWTYRELVAQCAARARFLLAQRRPGPFHIGILMDNRAEFPLWFGASILAGATMVGVNTTREGPDLARDIRHTDCQLVITEQRYAADLAGLELRDVIQVDVDAGGYRSLLEPYQGTPPPDVTVTSEDVAMLILTSGSTDAPKAVICSHGRTVEMAELVAGICGHGPDTVSLVSMPWFHAAALNQGWLPALAAGGATVVAPFSVSQFLPTVRRFGVTHFNYVGKPLAYLLSTPEAENDADNTLRMVLGNEAANDDITRFAERFDCEVHDGYGSTEGGITIYRVEGMPPGSLGVASSESIRVYDPETVSECPRAGFDEHGALLNANEAIGELVNTEAASSFEGYWNNPEATAKRTRHGILWSGDLVYRDKQGYFYFVGRDDSWLRVDGENIAAAQIEELVQRHRDVLLAAVYPVPDLQVGDRVMLAVQPSDEVTVEDFDVRGLDEFLQAQPDCSPKWVPSFVRVSAQLPLTATNKMLRSQLRTERWRVSDPMWWRPETGDPLRRMLTADMDAYERSSTNPLIHPATSQAWTGTTTSERDSAHA